MAGTNFPISGIQLVVKDAQKFVRDLGRAAQSGDDFTKRMERLRARLDAQRATQERYAASLRKIAKEGEDLRGVMARVEEEFGSVENAIQKTQEQLDKIAVKIKASKTEISQAQKEMTKLAGKGGPEFLAAKDKFMGLLFDRQDLLAQKKALEESLSAFKKLPIIQGYYNSVTRQIGLAEAELSSLEVTAGRTVSALSKIGVVAGVAFSALAAGVKFVLGDLKRLFNGLIEIGEFGFNAIKKGVSILAGAFEGLKNAIGKLFSPITSFLGRVIQIASGIALYDFVRGLIDDLKRVAIDVFDVIAEFQQITIRFRTIVAQDLAKQMGISFVDAMDMAIEKSIELLDWVKLLAVKTPFTTTDIANVLALGTAMGMPIQQSQRLTIAIGNMTAALGLGDEVMWRIIYNLGQMIQRGRLTGEEFRDLSRNLFPVYDVLERLAKQSGKTAEEMKAIALEGGVPVNDFINEFIVLVEEKFPDAMQKLSNTWKYLTQNVREFFTTIIGINMFGPLIDRFTTTAGDAFNRFVSDPNIMIFTKIFGETLSRAFDYITPAIDKFAQAMGNLFKATGLLPKQAQPFLTWITEASHGLSEIKEKTEDGILSENASAGIPVATQRLHDFLVKVLTGVALLSRMAEKAATFVNDLANKITGGLSGLGQKMYQFGQKIIEFLARGMASAVQLITHVIQFVARLLTSWFKPKSPPKVAKDIDKWGAETLTYWLQGFNKADFSIFNEIADTIESYLRSVAGKFGEKNTLWEVISGRVGLAQIMSKVKGGILTVNEAVSKIIGSIKYLSGEFRNYIRLVFETARAEGELEQASIRLKQAQKDIEIIQDRISVIQEKYGKILDELRAKLSKVTDEYEEQKRLKKIDAALATNLLTSDERERLEMEKQSILIKQQIRAKEEERDAIIGGLKYELQLAQERELRAKLDQEAAQEKLDALKAELDAAEALIQAQIKQNNLLQEFIDLLKSLQKALGGGGGGGKGGEDLGFLEPPGGLGGGLQLPDIDFDALWQEALDAADAIIAKFDQLFKPLDDLKMATDELKTSFGLMTQAFSMFDGSKVAAEFQKIKDAISGFLTTYIGGFEDVNYEDVGKAIAPKRTFKPGILIKELEHFLELVFSENGLKAVSDAIVPAVNAVRNLANALGVTGDSISKLGSGQKTFDLFIKALETLSLIVALKLLPTTARLQAWANVLRLISTISNMVRESLDKVKERIEKFQESWAKAEEILAQSEDWKERLDALLKSFVAFFDVLAGIVGHIFVTVLGVITTIFGSIGVYVQGWVNNIIGFFVDLYNVLVGHSIVPEMMSKIYEIITGTLEAIKNWVGERMDAIKTFFSNLKKDVEMSWGEFWGNLSQKVRDTLDGTGGIYEKIKTKLTDIRTEIENKMKDIKTKWEEKWDEIKNKVKSIFDPNDNESIVYKVINGITEMWSKFKEFGDNIAVFINNTLSPLAEAFRLVKDKIKEAIDKLLVWLGLKPGEEETTGRPTSGKRTGGGGKNQPNINMAQTGGSVRAFTPHIVGEVRREVFVPSQNGSIIPSVDKFLNVVAQRAVKLGLINRGVGGGVYGNVVAAQPVYNIYNIDNSTTITVDANYKNIESPLGIRYDIAAALATARI